jgi:hypothetical protein
VAPSAASQDYSTKFWCRARPGDPWKDNQRQEHEQLLATSVAPAGAGAGVGQRGLPGLMGGQQQQQVARAIPGLGGLSAQPPGKGSPGDTR